MSDSEKPPLDFGSLLSQLGQVRQNIEDAQQKAASETVEGSAGGGAVKVTLTGALEFKSVSIEPSVVERDDVEMLEDLVLAAVRDAMERARALTSGALGRAALEPLGGGVDLGGALGGLLGE